MKLIVHTQVFENYGDHWKPKGGETYILARFTPQYACILERKDWAKLVVDLTIAYGIEYKNEYSEEYVIDWSLEEDDYLTDDEKIQLEYEGRITHPLKDYSKGEYLV